MQESHSPSAAITAPDSDNTADDLTATEAAVAALNEAPVAESTQPTAQLIRPDAPMNYTVKRGDTLWDIAAVFLKDPWFWPEIWQINPQVENPHLIYPGDVLSLAYGANGDAQRHAFRSTVALDCSRDCAANLSTAPSTRFRSRPLPHSCRSPACSPKSRRSPLRTSSRSATTT